MASAAGLMPIASQCEEKGRLLRLYSFATIDYSRAVMVLHERSGIMSRLDFDAIRMYTEKVRELAEHAREELNRHLIEHRCF